MSGDWRSAGACQREDPELFFPIGVTGPAAMQIEQAKAVCRGCPVVEPCLEWALAVGDTEGVWGATSGDERRSMLQSGRAARPAASVA